MIRIGDIVYQRGCSSEHQKENPIKVRFLEWRTVEFLRDDTEIEITYLAASEDGRAWYAVDTLLEVTE